MSGNVIVFPKRGDHIGPAITGDDVGTNLLAMANYIDSIATSRRDPMLAFCLAEELRDMAKEGH